MQGVSERFLRLRLSIQQSQGTELSHIGPDRCDRLLGHGQILAINDLECHCQGATAFTAKHNPVFHLAGLATRSQIHRGKCTGDRLFAPGEQHMDIAENGCLYLYP